MIMFGIVKWAKNDQWGRTINRNSATFAADYSKSYSRIFKNFADLENLDKNASI